MNLSRRSALTAALGAWLSWPVRLSAQPSSRWVPKVDHLAIAVLDFDGVLSWYCDRLGFSVRQRWHQIQTGRKLAYLVHGATVVELIEADAGAEAHSLPATPAGYFAATGYNHVCFAVEDVELALMALRERGVETFAPPEERALGTSGWLRRIAFVRDPEGNLIELAEPMRRG